MNINNVLIHGFHDLLTYLLSFDSGWVFRGQYNSSWQLESTLERTLKPLGWQPELAITIETFALDQFKASAHHFASMDIMPQTKLGWLSLMQHHGVPTRLLDFTESSFVALFFAMDGSLGEDIDDCYSIWAINYRDIMNQSIQKYREFDKSFNLTYEQVLYERDKIFEESLDRYSNAILWITEPSTRNLRLSRQRGTFVFSCDIRTPIMQILESDRYRLNDNQVQKIVFPKSLRTDILSALRNMGISYCNMFPGLDGLSKDIKTRISSYIR